ncbi:MAG: hydantoinase B/oxoprolinase family protein [Planctomycetia bacterium]|nr:hydantoinase B/oxoprolinase family protein [Planctomycetia bacterium]
MGSRSAQEPEPLWQFWIDVGGTFCDCIGRRPDGTLARAKVLSSGVTKGVTAEGSTRDRIVDPLRFSDPPGFWIGYELHLLDEIGQSVTRSIVRSFDPGSGTIALALPLTLPLTSVIPAGTAYELRSTEEAPLLAIRRILRLKLSDPLPKIDVRLGTTRGTNALLTRTGARTAFVTTRGFGDVLRIAYQDRPRLFDLAIKKPAPLYATVVEIDERLDALGQVLRAPDEAQVREQLAALLPAGIESLAVCLLHADLEPRHEQLVGRVAAELGFREISLSSCVAPLPKIVPRGDTTVVDAYLNPVLRRYVAGLRARLGDSPLRILTSAGGLVAAEQFVGKDSILSGPAGGAVGLARAAAAAGCSKAIGFDMGGTSTDVSRYDGRFDMQYETQKAGVRVVAAMLAIETVAAGGGSICRFDGVKLVVGPESAGADPGPACYGHGGPLTVTDANLCLGRILSERFPFPLDRNAAHERLSALAVAMSTVTGVQHDPLTLAAGFVRVANANMAAAIRSISIAKGVDPRDYTLVAFGGAAGQHACAVAEELGIKSILSHPDAGLLSAYGIGHADVVRHAVAGLDCPYDAVAGVELDTVFARLSADARAGVEAEGIAASRISIVRRLDLRYAGTDVSLSIAAPADGDFAKAFAAEHQRLYGYLHPQRGLIVAAARVEAIGQAADPPPRSERVPPRDAVPDSTTALWCDGQVQDAAVFERRRLRPGDVLRGPAIVAEDAATTVVDAGWQAEVLSGGELLIERQDDSFTSHIGHRTSHVAPPTSDLPDPVLLEIFNNHFAGIAERMGITLRNTAVSVNVKERLDFSCAIFTAEGHLVVNAPHIPVHLGAMGHTVRRLIEDNPHMRPGDVLVTNDPYAGGSHLPDVTVVTPIHDAAGKQVLFFTASRAHHAEIGGTEPGSMPPFSRTLADEGVLIRNFKLVDAGTPRFDELKRLLSTAEYPSRAMPDNLADVAAQAAANRQGAAELAVLVDRYSLRVVDDYMRHIQAAAERKMRQALARLPDGRYEFRDCLDLCEPAEAAKSVPITVAITIAGDSAEFNFTGTAPVVPGNLNANPAIVSAAVMYVLRCLIDEDIPLNEGVLAPVRIVLPECLLNPPAHADPRRCAAVVGGNVETSQRVVDVLLGALGLAAASQGTMNNLLVGDAAFGYYETICGGSGATPGQDGADAVQTHMTNTRLTDPEVLERRYPLRLLEFSIRHSSAGISGPCGRRGGDGVVRRIELLRPLTVSILSQRRGQHPPYGLRGGGPGQIGCNTLIHPDGTRQLLPGQVRFDAQTGDVIVIETPGGGGA